MRTTERTMATITFTNASNQVYGYDYPGNNTYNLLKGEDYFFGGEERDVVYGGDGNDQIYGYSGNDTLYGGNGSDYLNSGVGFDRLYGDGAHDTLDSWDGDHDELLGGIGNDLIYADSDLVKAGDGADKVYISSYLGDFSSINLGNGADTLTTTLEEGDPATVKVQDFKAEDHLKINAYADCGDTFSTGAVFDALDINNDGWLGAKDTAADNPYDDFGVTVGSNFLELEVFDSSVILQGMTKASFDFLA